MSKIEQNLLRELIKAFKLIGGDDGHFSKFANPSHLSYEQLLEMQQLWSEIAEFEGDGYLTPPVVQHVETDEDDLRAEGWTEWKRRNQKPYPMLRAAVPITPDTKL